MVSKPSHVEPDLPPVDEHIVEPGSRQEMYDGELVVVPPAKEPHAERHSKVSALVEAHAAAEFNVASEMLTRTSWVDDFAPDVSVYPFARDPSTGGRQLEHLAFEVVSTQSLSHAGRKARKLVGRGVRRVFAIDVKRVRVLEWSDAVPGWRELDPTSHIEDLVFAVPLPIGALLHAGKADDAIMRALIAKKNPVAMDAITSSYDDGLAEGKQEGLAEGRREGKEEGRREGKEEGRQEGKEEGRQEGKEEGRQEGKEEGRRLGLACALVALLEERGFAVEEADRDRMFGETDLPRLRRWIRRAATCASVAELLST
jgi:Uma2 family endonuclease